MSFQSRMWLLFAVSFAAAIMLSIPEVLRDWTLDARVNEMKREIHNVAQNNDPLSAISTWLINAGFTDIGQVAAPPRVHRQQNHSLLAADLHLSDGTVFWRPRSVRVFVRLPDHEEFVSSANIDFSNRWYFATQGGHSSRWDRILPRCSILLPMAAICLIIVRVNQRKRHVRRGECAECCYPIGTNQVCTECGAAILTRPGDPPSRV